MVDSPYRGTPFGVMAAIVFFAVAVPRATLAAEAVANSPPAESTDAAAGSDAASASDPGGQLETVVVLAKRLNVARSEIETQTGASTYTISSEVISAAPGGENVSLNQALLQAPDVVQDSFGQIHVRGDHNGLQYRLNGIILPEGITVFSQTLSPRFLSSLSLITGALPAEYGLRTAGIIDLNTNSGLLQPGGSASLYGGSHGTFQPAAEYGGSAGSFNYYLMGDYKQTDIGIESPDASGHPLHDHATQIHGFGYFEDIVDANNRASLVLGVSDGEYQIPNQVGLQPGLGYDVQGVTLFPSEHLNENQHELAEFAMLSWQHSSGDLNWQTALSVRYTSLHFTPDWVGDVLYNGIAQDAFKSDLAVGWQADGAYRLGAFHTVRAGFYLQHDSATSNTTSQVLPLDPTGAQTSNVPLIILDNGSQAQEIESVYLQDEWKALTPLTINYGVRFDRYSAFSSGSQVEPRINFVWQALPGTIVHGGYSRYLTPPSFELIASETLSKFAGTSALPPGSVLLDTPPFAETSNYYDLGVQQKLLNNTLTFGVDAFYRQAAHLIDEGQFGAPIILTPFNYRYGLIEGVEFTGTYTSGNFSTYGNLAIQAGNGKQIESAQFNFSSADLNYIAANAIHLDHEGRVTASGGISYQWLGTLLSADFYFNTGLRQALVLPGGTIIPNGDHVPSYTTVNLGVSHAFQIGGGGPLTAQLAVLNLFDKTYQIRSGTGIGVFAPQYGAPRGVYGGLAWQF